MQALTPTIETGRLGQTLIIGLAVVAVAVADVLLKRATHQQDLGAALRSPWLWGTVGLYLMQIALFTLAFVSGWKLTSLGALQTVLYAVIVLAAGVLLFREALMPGQVVGVALAFVGVVLITWR